MSGKHLRQICILLAVIGLAVWGYRKYGGEVGPVGAAKAVPAIPVATTAAILEDVPISLDGLGTVTAANTVTVRTQVDGQLLQVLFREGQDVQAGAVLAQIDPRSYQAQLDQAMAKKAQNEAMLANARRDLGRYGALLKNEYATRQQVDTTQALVNQLEAAVKADQAAIENSRVLLGYTTIRSPIDGRAGFRQIDQGNVVHVNDATPMVVITQMHPINVVFTLPQDVLPDVIRAMAAAPLEVTTVSRDGRQVLDVGRLELVDNQIDQSTGTIRLKAVMPNQTGLLWPGQFVSAHLVLGVRRQAVTVPANAILRGQQGAYAYVVGADSTVEARPLTLGRGDESRVVVVAGLAAGETVVTDGQMRLKNGARIEVGASAAK
ncbi:efflux RND transporter periplasmic adaptor subunit [Magnetospirillum sp. 15-1]|uniref:efflux RND transporter periplasmic adaptor subunit n=1 Tax=Magnetospirillum sp. 15-1 TaxID=1979370 RepID=UPI000BBBEFC3|nr:efflux RND transporter periplasmic adaptor subunit [Magnetospirillum sp. 15-1]